MLAFLSSWLRRGNVRRAAVGRRAAVVLSAAVVLTFGVDSLGAGASTVGSVGALISAINSANSAGGPHTIVLAAGLDFELKTANNSVDGGNGLPVIGGAKAVAVTIVGNGATIRRSAGFSFDRSGAPKKPFRLFDVAAKGSLTLENVALEGGWAYGSGAAGCGGCVYNRGTLTIGDGSTFYLHMADDGGVIYNAGGTATVNDCTFVGGSVQVGTNAVVASNSALNNGGAIYNDAGTLTLRGCTLSESGAFLGGGIYNRAGTLTVADCVVSGNDARFGGGIYNAGGSVVVDDGSTLSGNVAFNVVGYGISGGGDGGGIYNDSAGAVVVEGGSAVTDNAADVRGADVNNLGALYLDATSKIGVVAGNAASSF
jgi:predicted outer membrane repeat protein